MIHKLIALVVACSLLTAFGCQPENKVSSEEARKEFEGGPMPPEVAEKIAAAQAGAAASASKAAQDSVRQQTGGGQ